MAEQDADRTPDPPADDAASQNAAEPQAGAEAQEAPAPSPDAAATADAADQSSTEETASAALAAAQEAADAARAAQHSGAESDGGASDQPGGQNGAAPFTPPSLENGAPAGDGSGIDLLSDVNLDVKIELGRTRMFVEDVLRLAEGAVVELDKLAGDPVDVYVNDRHVARGEVLILNDSFCVRVNEVLTHPTGKQ